MSTIDIAPARPAVHRDAWMPTRRALTEGSALPMVTVSTAEDATALAGALRDACSRSPWILGLAAADPHRLLNAAGIRVSGPGRKRFDAIRIAENWGERPDLFDTIAAAPPAGGIKLVSASTSTPVIAATTASAIDRLKSISQHTANSVLRPTTSPSTGASVPKTEAGRSHASSTNYAGTTGSWDVVAQLHESFLQRMWSVIFWAQVAAGLGVGNSGSASVIDFDYEVEAWLLVFTRMHLQIVQVGTPPCVTLAGAAPDEVGVSCRFTLALSSRWLPSQPWEQTDEFTGSFTRYGKLVKETSIQLAGQTWRRTWAADLANGRTVIALDDGPDGSREAMLEATLDNYFADELPLMPITPSFPVNEPLMTYPTSAAFTQQYAPDRNAATLCFHSNAETYIEDHPFRSYILDHGRNFAIGISIPALEREIVANLGLPRKDGSVTLEDVELAGIAPNRIELRFSGKGPLGIGFSHRAEMILRLVNGQITSEMDESTLNLPWYLWVLNALLIVPLVGLGGLISMGIANIIGSNVIGGKIEDLLDLGALTDMIAVDSGSSNVSTEIERLEVTSSGLFLKGNVEIAIV